MRTGTHSSAALGCLLLLLGSGACRRQAPPEAAPSASPPAEKAAAPAPRTRLVVGVSALRISMPLFVAAERGLFGKQGLDVELRPYVTAQPMVDDLSLGKLDAAGYAAWPILFLSMRDTARPAQVTTAIVEDRQHRLSYVLARAGSGLKFPAGAAGHRVGILPTVAYQKWLDAILRSAGVQLDTVKIVPLPPPMQIQALSEGGVDLLFTGDPMATAALGSGRAEIADDGPPCALRLGAPFSFGGFALSARLASERPEAARALVAAIDAAIVQIRTDPRGSRQAMAAHVRPEERGFVERYPEGQFLTSTELPPTWLQHEIERERALGILPNDGSLPAVSAFGSVPTP